MCCGSQNEPKWKREVVRDHKFDYVDIDEFYDPSCGARMEYMLIYVFVLKSFAVYIADLWSAVSLLSVGQMYADPAIPPEVSRWIFLASILVSFLLLGWDIFKAKRIIASRDISYTFTNIIASRYYSLKDYRYFCLFRRIQNSTKQVDSYAFFVFFTLKGWKRLLLTEAPRQVINIVTLIALAPKWVQMKEGTLTLHNAALGKSILQQIMTITMAFSVAIFIISFGLVCIAALMYVPLLCHIQGNLKEYCCHKVDKRITEILKKQARKRIQRNQRQQLRSDKTKNSSNGTKYDELPQPTLPNVDLDTPHYSPAPGYFYASHRRTTSMESGSDRVALIQHPQQSDRHWNAYADGAGTPYLAPNASPALSPYYHIP